jgi:hypothetical protein
MHLFTLYSTVPNARVHVVLYSTLLHLFMMYNKVPTAPVHITYLSNVPTALTLLLISTIHSYLDPFTLPSHDTVTTSLALLLIPCSFNSSLATLFPIHPLSHYLAFLYCFSSLTGVKVPPSPLYFFYASCYPSFTLLPVTYLPPYVGFSTSPSQLLILLPLLLLPKPPPLSVSSSPPCYSSLTPSCSSYAPCFLA